MLSRLIPACITGSALFFGVMSALGQSFSFSSVNYPGAVFTVPQGINPGGDIVGLYGDSAGITHGFVLRKGEEPAGIDYPDSQAGGHVIYTDARGISPGGDIVGFYFVQGEDPSVAAHGYMLRRDGTFVRVHDPDHLNEIPQRILPGGSILGCYHDHDEMNSMHGVVFSRGQWTGLPIGFSMTNGATPDLMHKTGLVFDSTAVPPRVRAFLLQNGTFAPFDFPGAASTQAWDMNPVGAIVGSYSNSSGGHGFLLENGTFTSIDFSGVGPHITTAARGINPRGDIVGWYRDATNNGQQQGFLATRLGSE
jgi:hypothetical protein